MSVEVELAGSFGDFTLDVAFTAPSGCVSLFGRSGAGKTSIAQAIAGLRRVERGRVVVDGDVLLDTQAGVDLPAHRRAIGVIFQDARLFPHLDVTGNLTFGERFRAGRMPSLSFDEIVDLLDIRPLLRRRPRDLSGGEKQRVAIGRALLSAPRLLVLDEPLTGLDGARAQQILVALERLRDHAALPMVHISHSLDEVARLADTLVLLGGGRVMQAGPAADLFADPALAAHFGTAHAGALLDATVRAHQGETTRLAIENFTLHLPRIDAEPGQTVRLRLRADDLSLGPVEIADPLYDTMQAVVAEEPIPVDGGLLVKLALGEQSLLVSTPRHVAGRLQLAPGTPVTVSVTGRPSLAR